MWIIVAEDFNEWNRNNVKSDFKSELRGSLKHMKYLSWDLIDMSTKISQVLLIQKWILKILMLYSLKRINKIYNKKQLT